jgi:hypothetical protein
MHCDRISSSNRTVGILRVRSIGKIIYSPTTHLASSEKWAILACDDEISKYYRHLYSMENCFLNGEKTGKLIRPIWGCHMSFSRGERFSKKLDEGKWIEFEYELPAETNGKYWWFKVICPELLDLREKLGLKRNPKVGLHLTFGIAAN